MKLYVQYVLTGQFPGEQDRNRSKNIRWDGKWSWTERNLAKVRRALSNANLKSSRIVIQNVQELDE